MFEIKKFASGEYEVKLVDRIYQTERNELELRWNWFIPEERDILLLLMKINAINVNYPLLKIKVVAPYCPYLRQDRIFEVGQGVPSLMLTNLFNSPKIKLHTMAAHSYLPCITNHKYDLRILGYLKYNIIFPDKNARHHFSGVGEYTSFRKERTDSGIYLYIDEQVDIQEKSSPESDAYSPNASKTFLICDDICAGGRTFIECARALHREYGCSIKIELLIYHAFLDYGLDNLKESGISKIKIINPDSYKYILELYTHDHDFFEYVELKRYLNV